MTVPIPGCVTCGKPMAGNYCSHCGEKRVGRADHTLRRLLEHLFEAFTNADGKVFLTLRRLLFHPGRLTFDYLRGSRKPVIPPLQLFLIGNLIYFLLHPLIGSNTLTTDLNTQLHYTWHRALTTAFVEPRLVARGLTAEAYAATFDPAAVAQARSLVILVVPIFSLAVAAIYWRQRRQYAAHLVFSLHFGTFWLLLTTTLLAVTDVVLRLLRAGAIFPSNEAVNGIVTGVTLAASTAYLFIAVRAVFATESTARTLAKAAGLALALQLSLQIYRFVLFFTTFWST